MQDRSVVSNRIRLKDRNSVLTVAVERPRFALLCMAFILRCKLGLNFSKNHVDVYALVGERH